MSLEEPSLSEMVRSIAAQLTRMETAQTTFVTRMEFEAYKELRETKDQVQTRDITELQEQSKSKGRLLWTVLLGPVIVGVVLFVLQGAMK